MSYKTYAEKLKDPRWQKKRLEILEAANWKCQSAACQSGSEATLHVHHKVYIKGKQPWEYDDWAYKSLCEDCHKYAQQKMDLAYQFLAKHDLLTESLADMESCDGNAGAFSSLCYSISIWNPDLQEKLLLVLQSSLKAFEDSYTIGFHNGKNSVQ